MPAPFLLDTNAYAVLFQRPKRPYYGSLLEKLRVGAGIEFYISSITSMEIHSVLGKWGRGKPVQQQACVREIMLEGSKSTCAHLWTSVEVKRMKTKVFRDLRKLVADIEQQRGELKAVVLGIDESCIGQAKALLMGHADRFAFGSHDALIAATALVARADWKIDLTLVTSDRGLKAVLRELSFPFFDPQNP